MGELITSSFGREGVKGFKYTDIREDIIQENDLFGDLVGHWLRHFGWDEERDKIYPDGDTLFKGERQEREIRMKEEDDIIVVEYGIPTEYKNSQEYVETVWTDEMYEVLDRNSEYSLEDYHVADWTLDNLTKSKKSMSC